MRETLGFGKELDAILFKESLVVAYEITTYLHDPNYQELRNELGSELYEITQ